MRALNVVSVSGCKLQINCCWEFSADAIHQANVPLNQQLMSQTHTVCSFYNGPFHCADMVEKMRENDEEVKKRHI